MKKSSVLKKQSVVKRKKRTSLTRTKKRPDPAVKMAIVRKAVSIALRFISLLSVIGIISVFFLYCYQYIVTCPYFELKRIVFTGTDNALEHRLKTICDAENDKTLLSVNLNRLKEQMEAFPWIRSVNLERSFPHTLIVHVEKQRPCAIFISGRHFYYLNMWAEPFVRTDHMPEMDLPVVTGLRIDQADLHRYLTCAVDIVRRLMYAHGPCSLNNLSEIHFGNSGDISLYFDGIPSEIRLSQGLFNNKEQEKRQRNLIKKFYELKRVIQNLNRNGKIQDVKKIYLNTTDDVVVSFGR